MFSVDIDNNGKIGPFEWVLLSVDMENKAAYKLAGANDNGTFAYSKQLDIDYKIDGGMIFTGPAGSFNAQDDSNSKTVNSHNDIKGYKLTSATHDSGYDKTTYVVEFYCDGTFKQDKTTTTEGLTPYIKTIRGTEANKVYIEDGYYPTIRWVGLDRFDQDAEGKIFFNGEDNKLIVNQSSFNGPTNSNYSLESIEKISSCN